MTTTPKRLVAGSQIAAIATSYYNATNCKTRIDACAITNTTAGAVTVSLYLVAAGGSGSASNCVCSAQSVAAGATFIPPGMIGQWIEPGGAIQALASAATSLTLVASGVEFT